MNSSLSVSVYRLMLQAYPAGFRSQYGDALDQSFRDGARDAFQKHGYLGLALLWLHVIPDYLFSFGEVLLSRAGDFLKWRFRLQWVVACSLGFAAARCVALIVGREFYTQLETHGTPGMVAATALRMAVLMSALGILQSRVLAGRCFRKKQWVLYAIAGTIIAAFVLQPLLLPLAPRQANLVRLVAQWSPGVLRSVAERLVTNAPIWMVIGALIGLLQAAAIKSDAISRYRWMRVCAVGYFLSALAGGFVIPYPFGVHAVPDLVMTSVAAGAILGLVTSGALERILLNGDLRDTAPPRV